ncbi:unnamed protein product [Closterium sp. NIES-64]|nr:unnamed protein product [Closterium sp. NIES-64]
MTGAAATGQRGVQVRRTGEHTGRAAHTGTRSTRGSIWAGRAAVHGQLGQCVGSWARGLRRAAGRAGRAWQQGARGARIAERTGRTGQQEARGSERGVRGAAYRARAGLQTGRAHGSGSERGTRRAEYGACAGQHTGYAPGSRARRVQGVAGRAGHAWQQGARGTRQQAVRGAGQQGALGAQGSGARCAGQWGGGAQGVGQREQT